MPRPPPRSTTSGAQPARARRSRFEPVDRLEPGARGRASCEPMCRWTPATSRPASRAAADRRERLVGREAELRAVVGGADRLVRVRVDPGRDAHEHSPHAGRGRALRLVERVEHDEARVRLGGGPQLLVALVVAVHDDPLAGNARRGGRTRARRASRRRRRSPPPRAAAGARRSGTPSGCRARARPALPRGRRARRQDRLLAVDDERRAELGGEIRGARRRRRSARRLRRRRSRGRARARARS